MKSLLYSWYLIQYGFIYFLDPFDDDCKDDKNLLIADDYQESFVNSPSDVYCNSDWNKIVTQSREDRKRDSMKSCAEELKKLDIEDKEIIIKNEG